MLLSLLIVLIIAFGGLALTYVFEKEESFLWRLSAGSIVGWAIFGTVGFVIASFLGLSALTVAIAIAVTLLPSLLLLDTGRKKIFLHDWAKAKGKLQGASWVKAARFAYYLFFLILFVVFFERTIFETPQGIFTGGSNNLGDLPFHLGAIFGFTEINSFPPQHPSFSGAKFSYPFISDFLTASLMKFGVSVREAMLVQNVSWAFALLVILERFVFKLTNDRLASKIAPALLFFSGGFGFIWFFGDYSAQAKGFFDFIWTLPKDYTISSDFRWGNSMVTLFITQRSILLGMPLTIIVLTCLWKIFTAETRRRGDGGTEFTAYHLPFTTFVVGLIAGLLPLTHLHSLAVLFVVTLFLFIIEPRKYREWISFGVGVCVTAVPQLIWSISGSATQTSKFFEFHFGWDAGQTNILWFWIKNTGIMFALIAAGIYLVYLQRSRGVVTEETIKNKKGKKGKEVIDSSLIPHPSSLLLFYLPFAFLFLISNIAKFAPWEWDNIKLLIYWFVGSLPFVAFALAWLWRKSAALRVNAATCFIVLIFSGVLDVWRTATGQINTKVFDADGVLVAERIKQRTPPNSLILNAPIYNSPVVLSGRQSLMRWTLHLRSYGVDYEERERDVKSMYAGGPAALALLQKYGIDYVLISPEEKNTVAANEAFYTQFPVIAEAGPYKVYKIK